MPRRTALSADIQSLEATEPLVDAPKRKIMRVRPGPVRETYFTLRLTPQEMDQLARVAVEQRTKPGTLARELILAGLLRLEASGSIDERVAAVEAALMELKQRVGAG